VIYAGVGVTLVLVLRLMSRRWREGDAQAELDAGGPYGPRPTPEKELVP
jgi:cytochrome bd ubiquinol oxidase subunit I